MLQHNAERASVFLASTNIKRRRCFFFYHFTESVSVLVFVLKLPGSDIGAETCYHEEDLLQCSPVLPGQIVGYYVQSSHGRFFRCPFPFIIG